MLTILKPRFTVSTVALFLPFPTYLESVSRNLKCKESYQIFVYIRRKKTLTEDEIWEMEDKLAALNKELEESLRNTSC